MNWKCPVCGSEDNAFDSLRCSCGYEMPVVVVRPKNVKGDDFSGKFSWLKKLGYIAALGVALLAIGVIVDVKVLIVFGIIAIIPGFVFSYVLTFLHWKERYIGSKSTLWGVLLAVETSGWFKIVYLFRHIIPDIRKSGRYSR